MEQTFGTLALMAHTQVLRWCKQSAAAA